MTKPCRANRASFLRTCAIVFFSLALLYPLYGCREKESRKISEIPEQSEIQETENGGNKESFPLSPEELAELGSATEKFSDTFHDTEDTETEAAPTPSSTSNVTEEVREQYTRLPDIDFVPKIIDKKNEGERYELRYRFEPNTNLRWNVSHRVWKKVLMSGHESEIETVSQIVRRWHIDGEEPDASSENRTVTYFIDEMILDQQESGKDPIRYDSRVDEEVPPEISIFGTEKAVGKELSRFKIDPFGMMTEKEKMMEEYGGNPKDSRVLFPFPSEPVAVGETWTLPYTIFLQNRDKTVKTVNAILKFTLTQVAGDLAVIEVHTVPTSIIGDPYLEAQLAERLFDGTCRFDIAGGKAVKTEIEFSRAVPEAYGTATFLDYRCRITEELQR